MNAVRERILIGIKPYLEFSEHKDLISFCVCSECFEDWEEIEEGYGADFDELVVVVDKEWLFDYMKKDRIENPLDYLKNEYTSDDSYEWFIDVAE